MTYINEAQNELLYQVEEMVNEVLIPLEGVGHRSMKVSAIGDYVKQSFTRVLALKSLIDEEDREESIFSGDSSVRRIAEHLCIIIDQELYRAICQNNEKGNAKILLINFIIYAQELEQQFLALTERVAKYRRLSQA